MKADMENNRIDMANLRVADLGLFADPEDSLKLMTLHRSKGREFDAVAIIDLLDGFIPHWTASTPDGIDEGRRLLYVGITRARKVLFYFTRPDRRKPPSRFLGPADLAVLD
jgi:DNA helicase-2/ATP-dependent DNA helicase PcrA